MSTVFPRLVVAASPLVTGAPGLLAAPIPAAIPQSSANPLVAEMVDPEAQRIERAKRKVRWSGIAEQAALEPDAFFQKYPPPNIPGDDVEARKKRLVNRTFVRAAIGGDALPPDAASFEVLRNRVADRLFDGRGKESDEAFHGEVVRHATAGKSRRAVFEAIAADASAVAITDTVTGGGAAQSWAATREKIKAMPGFKPEDEPEHLAHFTARVKADRAAMAGYADELRQVWGAMQQGGAGTFTEVAKEAAKGWRPGQPVPVESVTGAVRELGKKDAASTAFDIYAGMGEQDRAGFMNALGVLARTLPDKERPAFFSNLAKQGGRDVDALARSAGEASMMSGLRALGSMPLTVSGPGAGNLRPMTMTEAEATRAQFVARRNFASDVRRIEQQTFDPVRSAWGGDRPGAIEGGIYGIGGVLASTGEAAIPFVGWQLSYLSMQGQAYDDLRSQLMASGTSDAVASDFADRWAPLAAIPQAVLEKVQAGAWAGKIPGIQKAMDAAGDMIRNRALRFGARTVIGAAGETGIETVQDGILYAAQDIGSALGQNVPEVQWTGDGGALDGLWAQSGQTFVSMLPLAIIGAAGGNSREARARAFSEAGELRRAALGVKAEREAAIKAAKTIGEQVRAVEAALSDRDPFSESARAAVATLEAEGKASAAASGEMQTRGLLPRVVVTKDGFAVTDNVSGENIGNAPTREGAMKIAAAHYDALKDETGARVAYMASMLDAAAATVAADPESRVEVDPGQKMDIATAIEQGFGTLERYQQQVELEEIAGGGTGEMSRIINGMNRVESANGQRQTVSRLWAGANVATVIHEFGHGRRRDARASGLIGRADEIAFLRALDRVWGEKRAKGADGAAVSLRFIPDGMADEAVTEEMLDEGFSKALEMEIMRRRPGGAKRNAGAARADLVVGGGVVTANMKAIGRIVGQTAANKWRAFFDGIRAHFGLAMSRALALKKAEREGKFDVGQHEAYLSKVLGLSEVDELAGMVRDEHAAIMAGAGEFVASEDMPFSLANQGAGMNLSPVPTNEPGGANIGDGSLPGSSAIAPIWNRRTWSFQNDRGEETFSEILGFDVVFMDNEGTTRFVGKDWWVNFDESGKMEKSSGLPAELKEILNNEAQRITREVGPVGNEVFLRIGDLPRDGKSKNHVTGVLEKGVSVYGAKWNPLLHVYELHSATHAGTAIDLLYQGKQPAFYQGQTVGTGSDGEPLLQDAVKIADAKLTKNGFVPLGFDQSAPQPSGAAKSTSFSLAPASMADALKQRDADYLAAVESGDMETAQRMVEIAMMAAGFKKGWYEGGSGPVSNDIFSMAFRKRGNIPGVAYLTNSKRVAWFYATHGGIPANVASRTSKADRLLKSANRNPRLSNLAVKYSNPFKNSDATFDIYKNAVVSVRGKSAWDSMIEQTNEAQEADLEDRDINEEQAFAEILSDASFSGNDTEAFGDQNGLILAFSDWEVGNKMLEIGQFDSILYHDFETAKVTGEFSKPMTLVPLRSNQIKSADPVTRDADGNVIPLSQRFTPADDRISYSLAPASMADALAVRASEVKDPKAKHGMFQAMAKKLSEVVRTRDQFGIVAGKVVALRAVPDPRAAASLRKESAFREADLRARYEDEVSAKWQGLLDNEDLTKLKAQPVHGMLADPSSPLRGRVMSAKQAIARGLDFFDPKKHGDYDGADGVSRSVFGGTLMPDQAAQELFDAGLIKHPTPDAMWDALKREAASVARMKEHAAKAKAELADARARAKQEAAAWRKTAAKEQAAAYSPRKRLLRAMAMLDAILSSVPAEVRGKVGGYTPLARLGSDEAMFVFLQERLEMTEKAVEKYLVREYGKMFGKLLEREKVKKNAAGKRPKGKAGADVHALFATVREAMAWSGDKAESHVAGLEAELNNPNKPPTAEREAALLQEIGLVPLVADWKNADASRRAAAFESARNTLDEGMMEFTAAKLRERERRARARETLQGQTGKTGEAPERDAAMLARDGLKTGWKKYLWGFGSFEQIMHRIFGEDSAEAQRIVDMQREADFQKEDEAQAEGDGIEDLLTTLAGGDALEGARLHWRMSRADKQVMGRTLSEMQMVSATLMWRQEDGRRHMEGHKDENGNFTGRWHYGQDFVDACEASLSNEAKAVRSYLVDKYAAEWDALNPIFRKLYGIDLPRHANYSPLSVKPVLSKGDMADPVTGQAINGTSGTPPSLRTRAQGAIAEPDFKDAAALYLAHVKQLAHWKAFAGLQAEFAALIGHRDTRNTIEAVGGTDATLAVSKWQEYFTAGGFTDAAASLALFEGVSNMARNAAGVALVGRLGVLAVQGTQLGAAMAEMPTAAYASRMAKLFAGKLGWGDAIRSPYIQRRLKQMLPIVKIAVEGLGAAKPNRIKHEVTKLAQLINGADALFTAGTYAIILDYQRAKAIKAGATAEEAEAIATKAAERSTDRVAQPLRPGARSLAEVATASNPYFRLSWAFASEPRQKLAMAIFTAANPQASLARKARAFSVAWLVGGMGSTLIRTIWRDMREDDDEEWFDSRNWGWERLLLQTLTGPLNGLPIIGDMIEAGAFAATGEYLPEGNLLSYVPRAAGTFRRLPGYFTGKNDLEDAMKDAETVLSGFGVFSQSIGAAASLSHLARDLYGAANNAID